jgi:thiol-activated cytolysin
MSNAQELAQYIRGIAPIPFSEVAEPVVAGSKRSTAAIEGVECVVDEVTRRQTLTFDDMVAFDPNADALWPGSIVQGKHLRNGLLAPIALPRTPLAITITTPLGLSVITREVEHPSLASVTDAMRALLEPVGAATPGRISFQFSSASSLEQGMLSMGCDMKWLGGSARGDMSARVSSSQSLVIVKLTQAYLTVAARRPRLPRRRLRRP